jgi:hypothetical protein
MGQGKEPGCPIRLSGRECQEGGLGALATDCRAGGIGGAACASGYRTRPFP